mgnify:CR=1 FL=1|jgi:hypothetical protein|tara:strand:+ start:453 stop:626 length:174 start_codon:yes stop_codon:yes gene_type:complete
MKEVNYDTFDSFCHRLYNDNQDTRISLGLELPTFEEYYNENLSFLIKKFFCEERQAI